MHYCPYCGTVVKEDEEYCINCGKQLPSDSEKRHQSIKKFNRFWAIPMIVFFIITVSLVSFYFILENRSNKAMELYDKAEAYILEENYDQAHKLLLDANKYKSSFREAEVALKFINHVLRIENELNEADKLKEKLEFQEALTIVNDAESTLKNYHGVASTQMINHINEYRNDIKIVQLKEQLDKEPNIDDLKSLLWDIEIIKTTEADTITANIKKQIVDYTFSKASETLNNKQFNDALLLVEDGLKYVADSEKLQSLKTTIDKEQTAFEIAEQQRIEQAINIAAEEHELNTLEAIKLDSVKLEKNDQENIVIKGEVSSVATIPINSILVDYSILNGQGKEVLTNKVFVFPDKLYPDEKGKFEFTHFDINKDLKDIKVEVNKITWYTD